MLSQKEQKILACEAGSWKYPGSKEQFIRDSFEMSPTSYYQILNRLVNSEEALAQAPLVVNRLRKIRTARVLQRSARRL